MPEVNAKLKDLVRVSRNMLIDIKANAKQEVTKLERRSKTKSTQMRHAKNLRNLEKLADDSN